MVEEPGRYLEDFARAGADLLVIHQEASTPSPARFAENPRPGTFGRPVPESGNRP